MGAGGAGKLRAELESLKGFKGRIDGVLIYLGDSAAAPSRIAEARLGAGHLGADFAEADGLYSAYNEVHAQLETLSQLLADQIEALSTAILGARIGYANVDAAHRDRMWAIQRRTLELYDPSLDPHAKQRQAHPGGQPPGRPQQPGLRGDNEGTI
ncbi:hypothetical protein BLA24_19530 [Streptomyces cinnamoneus]|uniref:Uncharacterized protein n=1 Tax=Streptomyces cinnamoneus TaxID=53446 RepID=A0A2G1XF57_STRCJ|nr:hypothetical protein [Streptomyces cinnamoneus]PHQ49835.1 hypothetical protein BLA24_19530 [Streptomyces cinnamoneus]PPT13389.1 hypothetical protein CYQ11_11265 [Streptomyces cinnamoneus]